MAPSCPPIIRCHLTRQEEDRPQSREAGIHGLSEISFAVGNGLSKVDKYLQKEYSTPDEGGGCCGMTLLERNEADESD
jgi:hypothetical protein